MSKSLFKGILRKAAGAVIGFAAAAVVLTLNPVTTEAAAKTPVGFVQTATGISWMYTDGSVLKNNWLEVNGLKWHFDANGNLQTGLVTVGKNTYLLFANGVVGTGWQSIGDAIYYFNADGTMSKNTTINGFKIGADGKVQFTSEQLAAVQSKQSQSTQGVASGVPADASNTTLATTVSTILSSIITSDMTDDQKLQACFDWVCDTTSYKRTYETPSGDFTGTYAMDIFTTHQGNCYRYASAFAYLAKGCGFDARVITGQIKSAKGGLTPHGWTEVYVDGAWYLFDPDMADAKPVYRTAMFKTTYADYPVKPLNPQAVNAVHF